MRADDCLSDEGVEFAPWYVIEQADWVQVVAVTDAHEVVLIEQYRRFHNDVRPHSSLGNRTPAQFVRSLTVPEQPLVAIDF